MKRRILLILAVVILCGILGGCGFWMNGDYLSVTPNEPQIDISGNEIKEVATYAEMRDALKESVGKYADKCTVTISSSNHATVDFYIDSVIKYVTESTPLGAYAVDEITYEIGENRNNFVVAFQIRYSHSRSDVLGMPTISGIDNIKAAVTDALIENKAYIVLRTKKYEDIDFTQLVREFANNNPNLIMEVPQVGTFVYPKKGSDRIVEVTFTYQTDSETLRRMQEQVESVFTSAELYVKETTKVMDIYSRLFSFVMERNDYTVETSITPAYSLLHHGVGDSRAFANVYAAMCRNANLTCKVISGTRDGEPWCWNWVYYRGAYYHVDLLRCSQEGTFTMRTDADMTGYVWDYSAYPAEQNIQK